MSLLDLSEEKKQKIAKRLGTTPQQLEVEVSQKLSRMYNLDQVQEKEIPADELEELESRYSSEEDSFQFREKL